MKKRFATTLPFLVILPSISSANTFICSQDWTGSNPHAHCARTSGYASTSGNTQGEACAALDSAIWADYSAADKSCEFNWNVGGFRTSPSSCMEFVEEPNGHHHPEPRGGC